MPIVRARRRLLFTPALLMVVARRVPSERTIEQEAPLAYWKRADKLLIARANGEGRLIVPADLSVVDIVVPAHSEGRRSIYGLAEDHSRIRLWILSFSSLCVYQLPDDKRSHALLIRSVALKEYSTLAPECIRGLTLDSQGNAYVSSHAGVSVNVINTNKFKLKEVALPEVKK